MGHIFNHFGHLTYRNEDEVSQNFIIPLFTNFLGYKLNEIIPEMYFPARDFHSGVKKDGTTKVLNHKPDYIFCFDGENEKVLFVVDSKDSDQNVTKHYKQLRSYTVSVGSNLIIITNGSQFYIYDVNSPLFVAETIEELDVKFDAVKILLSKKQHAAKELPAIIADYHNKCRETFTFSTSTPFTPTKQQLLLSDFREYLNAVHEEFRVWQKQPVFENLLSIELHGFNPEELHSFSIFESKETLSPISDRKLYRLHELLDRGKGNVLLLIGQSGVGKSTLLRYITFQASENCLQQLSTDIPIYIELRKINHNTNLSELIIRALNHYSYSTESLIPELQNNNISLLLDGFDEVPESEIITLQHDIEAIKKYCKCLLTTRENRIPKIQGQIKFRINPLDDRKVQEITQHYFATTYYSFLNEVEFKGLKKESKNTLLLLLMISVYKSDNTLPPTLVYLTKHIMDSMKLWEDQKENRIPIRWEIIEKALGEIAYKLVDRQIVTINTQDINKILVEIIKNYSEARSIDSSITCDKLLDVILATGVLCRNGEEFEFWHRIFLNYFSSLLLAKKIEEDINCTDDILHHPLWRVSIIGCSAHLSDSSHLIESIANDSWLQSDCLIEAKKVSAPIRDLIIGKLVERCYSPNIEIRSRAINYLQRIGRTHTFDKFEELFHNCQYNNVKMIALEEFARGKSDGAKKLLFTLTNWKDGSGSIGRYSLCSVVRGLSFFEAQEYMEIIKIWEPLPDIWMEEECVKIFTELFYQNKLNSDVYKAIGQVLFRKINGNEGFINIRGLVKILSLLEIEELFPQLIRILHKTDKDYSLIHHEITVILSGFKNKKIIEQLFELTKDTNSTVANFCAVALKDSCGVVPIEIISNMIQNESDRIKLLGIMSLSRFPLYEIKEIISDLTVEIMNESNELSLCVKDTKTIEIVRRQEAYFSLLQNKGILPDFIRKKQLPIYIAQDTISILVETIEQNHMVDEILYLKQLLSYTIRIESPSDRLFIRFAKCFNSLGEFQIACDIIDDYIRGDRFLSSYILGDLLEILPYYNVEYAEKNPPTIASKLSE
ncbi:MAG: NACHT domain-containing protein [Ignavibacteria bacterium]|nr:NACHT domain-containing protein [Ignavibacteria bacterium]